VVVVVDESRNLRFEIAGQEVIFMQIFSSAENCRRAARRISFTICSAGPEILPSSTRPFCLIGADAGQTVSPFILASMSSRKAS